MDRCPICGECEPTALNATHWCCRLCGATWTTRGQLTSIGNAKRHRQ